MRLENPCHRKRNMRLLFTKGWITRLQLRLNEWLCHKQSFAITKFPTRTTITVVCFLNSRQNTYTPIRYENVEYVSLPQKDRFKNLCLFSISKYYNMTSLRSTHHFVACSEAGGGAGNVMHPDSIHGSTFSTKDNQAFHLSGAFALVSQLSRLRDRTPICSTSQRGV